MRSQLAKWLGGRLGARVQTGRWWSRRTLVVGPSEPVDGDSVACTKAVIEFLREHGLEACTLPTLQMFGQIDWILTRDDIHTACHGLMTSRNTTTDLQAAYDALIAEWRPDEIVLVDGPRRRLGFDPRGVPVFVIDHHVEGTTSDDAKAYIQPASSAGCLLMSRFGIFNPILAVSVLTDTFWLRQNLPAHAVLSLASLVKNGGLTDDVLVEIQRKLMVKKDPQIIKALQDSTLKLTRDGECAFVVLTDNRPEIHRGVMAELGYFCRHLCVVRGDGYTSLLTDSKSADMRDIVKKFVPGRGTGGGHTNKAAIQFASVSRALLLELYEEFLRAVDPKALAEAE